MWEDLVVNVFGPTIKFINSECVAALIADAGQSYAESNRVAPGIQEVTTFLKFMGVMLDKVFLREEFEQKEKLMEAEGRYMCIHFALLIPQLLSNSTALNSNYYSIVISIPITIY